MDKRIYALSKYPLITGISLITALILVTAGCGSGKKSDETVQKNPECKVEKSFFGLMPDGDSVMHYTLTNEQDITVTITNYGGIITGIYTPDKEGKTTNITLGFDNLDQYMAVQSNFGALIGRYGNRIAGARFTLDGEEYTLAANNGNNSLHGGLEGFNQKLWIPEVISCDERAAIKLTYSSPDGEEGYPGKLDVTVIYELLMDQLFITYEAVSDKPTVLNLTNHAYFNLSGQGTIVDHVAYINASRYTPVNDELIPTGELANVEGTPFDFRKPAVIGSRFDQLTGVPVGYDHNFVLDGAEGERRLAAKVHDPLSGRFLEVSTTEPGVQFYTGNFLDGSLSSGNWTYVQHSGFCLETQHFPDSPNQDNFPSTVLRPGETFASQTILKFGVEQ